MGPSSFVMPLLSLPRPFLLVHPKVFSFSSLLFELVGISLIWFYHLTSYYLICYFIFVGWWRIPWCLIDWLPRNLKKENTRGKILQIQLNAIRVCLCSNIHLIPVVITSLKSRKLFDLEDLVISIKCSNVGFQPSMKPWFTSVSIVDHSLFPMFGVFWLEIRCQLKINKYTLCVKLAEFITANKGLSLLLS